MNVVLKVYIQGLGFPGDVVLVGDAAHARKLIDAGLAEEVPEGA